MELDNQGRRYRVDDWDLKDLFRGVGRNESACRYRIMESMVRFHSDNRRNHLAEWRTLAATLRGQAEVHSALRGMFNLAEKNT